MTQNNPFADAFKMFDAFKGFGAQSPNVNFDETIALAKRNYETWQEANQVLAEAAQEIAGLNARIAEQNTKNAMELLNSIASSKDPRESAAKQADFAQEVFEKASKDAKQISDIAQKSSNKANDLIKNQISKNIREAGKAVAQQPNPANKQAA